jgi:hypothetical protein
MGLHLVQIARDEERKVALVDEHSLRCLVGTATVYELVQLCLKRSQRLTRLARDLAIGEVLRYDEV